MNRRTTITLAITMAVALAAMPLGAATAGASEHEQSDETDSIAPGEQLSGVVGVQEAEVQGELSERTYGLKLAKAETDAERAAVVEEQLADVEDRLADLEGRLEDLEAARESGEISEGRYRAEVAAIAAERATVERTAESAAATANDLPADVLADRGIDVDAIDELRTNASELGGDAVAEIARSIAGDAVGQSPAPDREPGAPIETPGGDGADRAGDRDGADDSDGETADEPSGADDATDDNATDSPDDSDDGTENRP